MNKRPVRKQISSGGVVYHRVESKLQVALISVGEDLRWQLPKGHVDRGETEEEAALREVREETGLETEFIAPIDSIDYWFYTNEDGERIRVHKYVYFYLLRYSSGDLDDHDFEVNEAAWVDIDQAIDLLTYESEKRILEMAQRMIEAN